MWTHERIGSPTPSMTRRASAFSPPRRAPEQTRESSARGSTASFDFAKIPIQPSISGRSRTSKGPCSCGATCPKCTRNPKGSSGEPSTRSGGTTRDEDAAAPVAAGAAPAAPPARRAQLASGPRYTPNGAIAPTTAGGLKSVGPFVFDAVFAHDPANGIYAGCGEIHQDIKWNAAAANSFNSIYSRRVPHSGFPASHPHNVWIEDRDSADTRYGRRSGPMSDPGSGDQYTDSTGAQNQAHGAIYHGSDNPRDWDAALAGRWTFMVLAFDMCNRGVQVGNADFITIDW